MRPIGTRRKARTGIAATTSWNKKWKRKETATNKELRTEVKRVGFLGREEVGQ